MRLNLNKTLNIEKMKKVGQYSEIKSVIYFTFFVVQMFLSMGFSVSSTNSQNPFLFQTRDLRY